MIATMEASFPSKQDLKQGEDTELRWAIREADGKGFIFVNNYERFYPLSAKKGVILEACGVKLPKMNIPSGTMAIFPTLKTINAAGRSRLKKKGIPEIGSNIHCQQPG